MGWFNPAGQWPEEVAARLKELSEQGCSELNAILECINDAVADAEDAHDAIRTGLLMLGEFQSSAHAVRILLLEHGGLETIYRLKIMMDDDPTSPREWDNVGTMACWHGRYVLGDEQPTSDPHEYMLGIIGEVDGDFEEKLNEWREEQWNLRCEPVEGDVYRKAQAELDREYNEKIEEKLDEIAIVLPLYLYDHGGITMRTSSFSCPWDSGQVGFIYALKTKVLEECGGDSDEEKLQTGVKILTGEVESYDQYLRGDIWGFQMEKAKLPPDVDVNELDPNDNTLDWEDHESCWGFHGNDVEESGMLDHIGNEFREAAEDAASNYDKWVLAREKVSNGG